MNTITKESIVDTIEGLEQLTNRGIQSVYIDMAIAGLRRLQASLEAEPVAWRCDSGSIANRRVVTVSKVVADSWGEKGVKVSPLYVAPPEPVSVPDFGALTKCIVQRLVDYGVADDDAIASAEEFVYKACRAAMLQGADGNSPVIPDGWVPCSERMPSVGEKVLAYRPDAPESNDPLIKMAKYVGKSAHGHGFDCYCKPSHWMLLPSAPQQEVK